MRIGPGSGDGCQRVVLADSPSSDNGGVLAATAVYDGGQAWVTQFGIEANTAIESADAQSGVAITPEIVENQTIEFTDLVISVEDDQKVTIYIDNNGTPGSSIYVLYMSARSVVQLTTRSWPNIPGATGRTVKVMTSAAGNISITPLFKTNV